MFRRTREGDLLVARSRRKGDVDWQEVCLHHVGQNRWADGGGVVEVSLDSAAVWSAMFAGIEHHPRLESCVPGWRSSTLRRLRPWPLKGLGTIVFDAASFLEHVVDYVTSLQGPVLFPDGARKLALPTAEIVPSMQSRLQGQSLWSVLREHQLSLPSTYGELLQASAEVRRGILDLSTAQYGGEGRRTVRLASRPFGWEYGPRTWSHGAAIRSVDAGGAAERGGCRPGDVLLSANGQWLYDAPIAEMDEALQGGRLPLALEVEQPVLNEPLYLREAPLELLRKLGGDAVGPAAERLLPRLRELFGRQVPLSEQEPKVFVGDGGSASHLHADQEPQLQLCHVLHGTKLFGVGAFPTLEMRELRKRKRAGEEIRFPAAAELSPEGSAWLECEGTSVAVCRAGDILAFWGGSPHFGANGMVPSPCVALFHGCG